MSTRKILNVQRVGCFNGGEQAPEDLPFPSCLSAALDAIGQPNEWETCVEPDKTWRVNLTNKRLVAATGMGFAVLWYKGEPCPSSTDLTLANGHDETIRRAFAYVGRRYETVLVKPAGPTAPFTPSIADGTDEAALFARVRANIDAGVPVIAFGIVLAPEACLITGYETSDETGPDGDAIFGWTFFPEHAGPLEPNGMFRKTNWAKDTWKLVFIGDRTEPTLSDEQVIRGGAETLRRTASAGYHTDDVGYFAGEAAFDAWRAYVEAPLPNPDDEASCYARHFLHHIMVGTLAEARCYAGDYLRLIADSLEVNSEQKLKQKLYIRSLRQAAAMFAAEHDLMWDAWNTLGHIGSPDAWREFKNPAKRAKIATILTDAQRLDHLASRYLDRAIAEKLQWQA